MHRLRDTILRRAWTSGLFLILGTLNLVWWGYSYGHTNHCVQLPILKSYLTGLYPNDIMVGVAGGYVTAYYPFLAVLHLAVRDLPLLFFSMHLIATAATLAALFQLALVITRSRITAIIAVLLCSLKLYDLQLGGVLHRGFHSHTVAALPLAFWALSSYLRGHAMRAFLLAGFTFNVNAQTATYVTAMLGTAHLLDIRTRGLKQTLRDYAGFFVAAAPCLIWVFLTGHGPLSDDLLRLYKLRSAHHSFPSSWSQTKLLTYASFLVVGIGCFEHVYFRRTSQTQRHVMAFALAAAILCLCGVLFTDLWPIKFAIRAQPFRCTSILTMLIMIYAAHSICTTWRRNLRGCDRARVHWIWRRNWAAMWVSVSLLYVLFFPAYRQWLPLVAAAHIIVHARHTPFRSVVPIIALYALYIFAGQDVVLPGAPSWDATYAQLKPLVDHPQSILLGFILVAWGVAQFGRHKRVRDAIMACSLAALVGYAWPRVYRHASETTGFVTAWHDLQHWVRNSTPQSAIFITPPYINGFRVYADRTTVVEWKDGTMQFFDDTFAHEWWRRIQRVGRGKSDYLRLDSTRFRKLATQYGANYVVTETSHRPLSFPVAYRNSALVAYRID